MNKTGLIAKISIKYVLPRCIWKYFWRIFRYFAFVGEFCGISQKYLNFAGPRPREISEALYSVTIDHGTKVAKFATFTAILASCQFFPSCYGDQNGCSLECWL